MHTFVRRMALAGAFAVVPGQDLAPAAVPLLDLVPHPFLGFLALMGLLTWHTVCVGRKIVKRFPAQPRLPSTRCL
jgi:hypothetical protein